MQKGLKKFGVRSGERERVGGETGRQQQAQYIRLCKHNKSSSTNEHYVEAAQTF